MEHTTEAVLLAKAAGGPVKVRLDAAKKISGSTSIAPIRFWAARASASPLTVTHVAYEAKKEIVVRRPVAAAVSWFYAKKKPADMPWFDLVGGPFRHSRNEAGISPLTSRCPSALAPSAATTIRITALC